MTRYLVLLILFCCIICSAICVLIENDVIDEEIKQFDSAFNANISDIGYIFSQAEHANQSQVIRKKYLLGDLSLPKKKIEFIFYVFENVTHTTVLYYDYSNAANALEEIEPIIIPESEYNSLPTDAISLVINIGDIDVEFSAVNESIREYILYKKRLHESDKQRADSFYLWHEIYFNSLTYSLKDWLGDFIKYQTSDYEASLCPQTLYLSKKWLNGQLVVEALQATITTQDDLETLKIFLEINKNNEIRVLLFNMMTDVLGTEIFLLLPNLQYFDNIVFFGLVDVKKSEQSVDFFLYDLANREIVTSNYLFIDAFLSNYTSTELSLDKLQVPIDINAELKEVGSFMNFIMKYEKNISLFHIYASKKKQFLRWGVRLLKISSVSLILEYKLFDQTNLPYCRVYKAKWKQYVAIEFRGDCPWYRVLPNDCTHYRIFSQEESLHGHTIEWSSKIAGFQSAVTLLIDDKSGSLSEALIQQWDTSCDLGQLTKIVMNIPSIKKTKNLRNCPQLKDILLNYLKHRTEMHSTLESILLIIAFHRWDVEKLPDRGGFIEAFKMSKADDSKVSRTERFKQSWRSKHSYY